mgnify:CR=1 FL=1
MLKSNIKRTSTMMKRLFPTALAVLLLLLAGCTAKPNTSNQSKPAEYYLTDTDLPLDDAARLRAAPDFLTAVSFFASLWDREMAIGISSGVSSQA